MKEEKQDVWLTPVEAGKRTALRAKTIYHYLQTGRLAYTKLGNGRGSRVRIKESDLIAFMESGRRAAFNMKEVSHE